jgi:HEPN domain-containing protein
MDKSISWAERQLKGSALIDLGYRDYIAARFLLNNQFIIQGLTLASTAVEKYLKSLLLFNLNEREWYNYHFDRIEKLQDLLDKHYFDVTEEFDPVFLSILERAFKIRYYDGLKQPMEFGFYLNQFIGELDNTINLLETSLGPDISLNSLTPYKRAVQSKDQYLFENNYVLTGQDKKTFMEKPTIAFSIHIYISSLTHTEQPLIGTDITPPVYEGQLSIFSDFQPNWFVDASAQ